MSKYIKSIRLREDRAEALKDKAMELTVKKKDYVKETDIVNFLIDEFTARIDIDLHGLYIKEGTEE